MKNKTKKILRIFKWRVRLVQQGYDLGWDHGFEAGAVERQNEILAILSHHIDSIDWLREEPLDVRDIIPIVKKSLEEVKEEITWQ